MRKLASIQKIEWINPIEGKDRIELVGVLGWQVICKKGEYNIGDLTVFCEIDSVLPEKEEFEFLRKNKFRIKTMKMGGVLSQGICFPLNILPKENYIIDQDVTELMRIKQYEKTMDKEFEVENICENKKFKHPFFTKFLFKFKIFRNLLLPKKQNKGFPDFISKTDESRIQNCPFYLNLDCNYIATEKIDGCVVGETSIKTDIGDLKISKIVNNKMDIKVLSYNENLKQCEFKKITDWHKIKANKQLYKIGVGFKGKGNREKFIECTENHKFLTRDRGWKRADELNKNDFLMHYNKNYENELKEIILGCLLGDSSFNSNTKNGVYRTINFNHSIKQEEYFNYKAKLFGNLFLKQKNKISGFGSEILNGVLINNIELNKIYNICTVNNNKTVNYKWANELTPISLAFWFMDDGNLQNRNDKNLQCRSTINTQGFTLEENMILQEVLKNKFNIGCEIGNKETYKGYILIFNTESTKKLTTIIAPYICNSMKYKLPKKYENMKCFFEDFSFDIIESVIETEILSIEKIDMKKNKEKYVYDLEIQDNHNYFAKNILIHNCSGSFSLQRIKGKYFWQKDKFDYSVCSRNLRLWNKNDSSYWKVSDKYNIEQVLHNLIGDNEWVSIQGECLDTNVQGNKYKVKEVDLYVFNLIYPNGRLNSIEAKEIIEKQGMKFVPIIDESINLKGMSVNEVLDYATDKSKLYNTLREGIVFRSLDGKQSFKAVSPDFLIKNNE